MPWKKSEPMEQRMEFALKALRSENFRALCQEYGISTKTGYKWRGRVLCEGFAGVDAESRRPRSMSPQLSQAALRELRGLEQGQPHFGPRKHPQVHLPQHR